MTTLTEITLNSFVRRVAKSNELKAQIKLTGCSLQRKGRSRNWLLKASFNQQEKNVNLIYSSEEPSWQWIAKQLIEQKKKLTFKELSVIASQHKGITVNQLIMITDCTVTQARRIIDQLEGF